MPTPRKSAEIDLIEQRLRDAQAVLVADYRGLTVSNLAVLRNQLRPTDTEFRIVKNTLTRIAAERAGIEGMTAMLEGPTAVAFANDDVATPARILADFARTSRILTLKGAILGGRALDAAQVSDLAALKPKNELRAELAGQVQAPLSNLVGLLNGALQSLLYTLEARAEQLPAA